MVNREAIKAAGFTDAEIDAINLYCQHVTHLDTTAWPVMLPNGEVVLVCKTVADAIRLVRPDLPVACIKT